MPPQGYPRVPPALPSFLSTRGPEPSQEALDALWSKTRAVRVYQGELGESGPLAREPVVELRGADIAELARLLSFDVPAARFRVGALGSCVLELRGRLFRVGLLGLVETGVLRVIGWGSDVRLRDPRALYAWLESKGGPALAEEHQRAAGEAEAAGGAFQAGARAWIGAAPGPLAAFAESALKHPVETRAALLFREAEALSRAEPRAGRRIAGLLRWAGAPPSDWTHSALAAIPLGLLSYERIADVLDVIEQEPLDAAQSAGAGAYLRRVAGHGCVAARAARWPEPLRKSLPEGAFIEPCRDIEGGEILATSAHGLALSSLHVSDDDLLMVDGPLLVRTGRDGGDRRALGPMERLLGRSGDTAVGVLWREVVTAPLDAAEAKPSVAIRPWPTQSATLGAVAAARLYRDEHEHRGRGREPWTCVVREPLGEGRAEVVCPARRGIITSLAVIDGDVLALFRSTTHGFGLASTPRSRHELVRVPAGGAAPHGIHRLDTETGISLPMAAAPRRGGGARAWIASGALTSVEWLDLPSGARGTLDLGAPVRCLGAFEDGVWAVLEPETHRHVVVRAQLDGRRDTVGSFRCESGELAVCPDGNDGCRVLVAACDKLLRYEAR